jgi:hypothetical protein
MYMFDPDSNLYVNSRDQDEFLRYDERTGVFLDTILSRGSGALEILRGLVFRCSPFNILKKVNPPNRVRLPYHTHRRIDLCEYPKTGANHVPIPRAFIIAE